MGFPVSKFVQETSCTDLDSNFNQKGEERREGVYLEACRFRSLHTRLEGWVSTRMCTLVLGSPTGRKSGHGSLLCTGFFIVVVVVDRYEGGVRDSF